MATNSGWRLLWLCLTLGLLPGLSHQASIAENDYYTAGVVEFRHTVLSTSAWSDNLAGYLEIVQSANASETDIIVFPELTLNSLGPQTFVPEPKDQIAPCLADPSATHYAEFLVALSCAARNASKYLVINVSEQKLCTDTPEDPRPCAANGLNIHNTNVVFDRQGVVISRYRKVHLYGENRNSTYQPELETFETDFGVTFGHFICFDILFYTPAHQLILEQGITDFVYPSMWFSQLPFLTGVQTQLAWAYANDVNMLAAGASRPLVGSSGSGIYHGREGALTSVMVQGTGERSLHVAQVPKYPARRATRRRRQRRDLSGAREAISSSSFTMKRDYLENYQSELLSIVANQSGSLTRDICHEKFCCHFDMEWRPVEGGGGGTANYRLGAYDGWRNEASVDANYIRNCGLFACSGPTIEECGGLLPAEQQGPVSAFTRLEIGATYPESSEFLLMPSTVLDSLLPLQPSQFEWSQQKPSENSYQHEVRFALRDSAEAGKLLTFAIYGNYYDETCTFGVGSEEQQVACGYKNGSTRLVLFAAGLLLPLLLLLRG
ncbi:LOW QUALITY PROTEIN: vanin-like protein 1 [Drosophila obscura]|uniref:LOW QUALITY PROTEIN: vanin-like protein 1 n=1 Tax=Drosophila obscura TaxID=7282 RepID=UPI000B9FA1DE|nr:LOW QUALITY PROTEIN: vanin-like protein 1 [Drosophila obscura]